jgi:FAD synthetase
LPVSTLDSDPTCAGTVLLHLYAAALAKRNANPSIPALYIPVSSPFPALEAFISHALRVYNLSVFTCATPSPTATPIGSPTGGDDTNSTDGMRGALESFRARFPTVEAILVGTRRTDPHGGVHVIFLPAYLFC